MKKPAGNEKRVLITGGAGFIGQSIVKRFKQKGHQACIFDLESPQLSCGNFLKGDVFNFEQLADVVRDYDVVIHLTGLGDAGIAQKDPAKSFRLNVVSLQNILEACRVHDNKKLIFPSSASVYGIAETLPIKENFPPNPTNVYSWHKYICEQLIKVYHHNFGLQYVILRLFNVYGRGNKGVINSFLKKAANGGTIESFGPYQYRDFVYAGDIAEAFYKSAIYEKANNRIINIGSGKGTQIKEILDIVLEIFPKAKWVHKKANFIMYDLIADVTLAKILLDFKPRDSKEFMKKIIMHEMIDEITS